MFCFSARLARSLAPLDSLLSRVSFFLILFCSARRLHALNEETKARARNTANSFVARLSSSRGGLARAFFAVLCVYVLCVREGGREARRCIEEERENEGFGEREREGGAKVFSHCENCYFRRCCFVSLA